MRKTVAIIAVCLALTSCGPTPTHEQWQERQDREAASRITKFNYEGHSYLLYQAVGSTHTAAGICHDENCSCKRGGVE